MPALAASLIAQGKRSRIDEKAAIAIFGEAGQAVDFGDRNSGSLHRLDERIGEPLGGLVERHQLNGGIRGRNRRVAPAGPKRNAAEDSAPRPERSQNPPPFSQDRSRR